jgi:UDPglucose 6-dehydrogenase
MRITVMGTGYVGLVTGVCLAELGNDVVCFDVDADKIRAMNGGHCPIYEPGLEEMVVRNRGLGRLKFSADVVDSVHHGDIVYIAVGTPPDAEGRADLTYVLSAARSIGRWMRSPKVIVDKSTVPVGTAEQVEQLIAQELARRGQSETADKPMGELTYCVVSNPEFLKEGAAIEDFMRPDRIVLGIDPGPFSQTAQEWMQQLYGPLNRHHQRTYLMGRRAAEFTKYAANAMLATRISFMNDLANLAERLDVDIEQVRMGIGSDPRIGFSFLYAGTGYGGSCFPKDVQALQHMGLDLGYPMRLLSAVDAINQYQKLRLVEKVTALYGDDLSGRCFALWGLSFKPNTDDVREAPSRLLVRELTRRGALVRAYDPVAGQAACEALKSDLGLEVFSTQFELVDEPYQALEGCAALLIATEWKAFRSPDFDRMKSLLTDRRIFDGRNMYEPEVMRQHGMDYHGIGRMARTRSAQEAQSTERTDTLLRA